MKSLAEGRAFLLLDGIDEVGDRGAREDLKKAVLDGLNRYPRCRWLLSSRIVGYEEVPFDAESFQISEGRNIGENSAEIKQSVLRKVVRTSGRSEENGFTTRYIAPFDDERITALVRNWYAQRERPASLARESTKHLVNAVRADQAILRLARIPNLLILMALIHRIEATLPHGRALLYDRITEAYLESIDRFRGIDLGSHDLPRKRRWLARVGFEMQRRRTSQDNTDGTDIVVDFDTVQDWLNEEMQRGPMFPGSPSAHEFLEIVGRRSGLFLPRGDKRYAFVHLSFQEYFAAVALEREVTRLRWAKHKRSRLGFDRDAVAEWAGKSTWCETFSFVFELLASQEEEDWHAELVKCVFGKNFERLNESALDEDNFEQFFSLGNLLARLVVNTRSGLPPQVRDQAIAASVRVQLQIQNGKQFYMPDERRLVPQSIFNHLFGNNVDFDAKVLEEVGTQMEHLVASRLDLSAMPISNVLALSNLTSLQALELDCTRVSELQPLANLTALERLNLEDTMVSDLAPLASLTSLKRLDLNRTQVSDLVPLASLTSLKWLDLDHTQVSDLRPLANLTALKRLDLRATQVSDLGPLRNATSLEWLDLDHTQVSDLRPLTKLTALKRLDLRATQVSDLGPLRNATSLEWLKLNGTRVSDVGAMGNMTSLEWLDLDDTQISDLRPLACLTSLRLLSLKGTQVADIGPLENLASLEWLSLGGTQVLDLIPLANLTALRWLDLKGTEASDLRPLANLTKLIRLDLAGTKVSDLGPLSTLPALQVLVFKDSQIPTDQAAGLQDAIPSLRIIREVSE